MDTPDPSHDITINVFYIPSVDRWGAISNVQVGERPSAVDIANWPLEALAACLATMEVPLPWGYRVSDRNMLHGEEFRDPEDFRREVQDLVRAKEAVSALGAAASVAVGHPVRRCAVRGCIETVATELVLSDTGLPENPSLDFCHTDGALFIPKLRQTRQSILQQYLVEIDGELANELLDAAVARAVRIGMEMERGERTAAQRTETEAAATVEENSVSGEPPMPQHTWSEAWRFDIIDNLRDLAKRHQGTSVGQLIVDAFRCSPGTRSPTIEDLAKVDDERLLDGFTNLWDNRSAFG